MNENEIEINGKKYVLASSVKGKRESIENDKYTMVRSKYAGVFAGYLKSRKGQEVTLRDARRIFYWKGAASLSQLAQEGTTCPTECKFPVAVDEVLLLEVIEMIPITPKAKASIEAVAIWKA